MPRFSYQSCISNCCWSWIKLASSFEMLLNTARFRSVRFHFFPTVRGEQTNGHLTVLTVMETPTTVVCSSTQNLQLLEVSFPSCCMHEMIHLIWFMKPNQGNFWPRLSSTYLQSSLVQPFEPLKTLHTVYIACSSISILSVYVCRIAVK